MFQQNASMLKSIFSLQGDFHNMMPLFILALFARSHILAMPVDTICLPPRASDIIFILDKYFRPLSARCARLRFDDAIILIDVTDEREIQRGI